MKTERGSDKLFAQTSEHAQPLAARMRPQKLADFIGQEHIIGEGRLLRRAIQKDQLSSLIFSGPPGTGKTTLAQVIAHSTKSKFISLNAVLAGIAEIRAAIEAAKNEHELYGRKTILFVDEVHRWNKAQQDALLPWVENGTIILIGATTENPFFEVNRALVSRSRIFQLKALNDDDLLNIAKAAISNKEVGYGNYKIEFETGALEHIVSVASGDARNLLNALELAIETSVPTWPPAAVATLRVSMATAEESIQARAILYDKDGEYHYDTISAFIKSVRGSDPDASLYWLARMLYGGESPNFIFRRLIVSACEDIGLADPNAITVVLNCAQSFDRIGLPEGYFMLSQATLYLATAPKSNSTLAFFDALKSVESEAAEVPNHIKDSSRDKEGFGHGQGYLYPHSYNEHWVTQSYLPKSLQGRVFYNPGKLGLEGERRPLVLQRREAQLVQIMANIEEEEKKIEVGLVWSKQGEGRRKWQSRNEYFLSDRLALMREKIFEGAGIAPHDRVLVLNAGAGLLVWEGLRAAREGTVAATVSTPSQAQILEHYAASISEEILRPHIVQVDNNLAITAQIAAALGFKKFDKIISCDLLKNDKARELIDELAHEHRASTITSCEFLARESGRLSGLQIQMQNKSDQELWQRYQEFETEFFATAIHSELGPSSDEMQMRKKYFQEKFPKCTITELELDYRRRISEEELAGWLSPDSIYGAALRTKFTNSEISQLQKILSSILGQEIQWPLKLWLIHAHA